MKKAGKIILIIIIILLVAGIGYGGYFLFDKLNVANNEINDLKTQIANYGEKEKSENTIENNKSNENSSENNDEDKANDAIRKALKDKQWVRENCVYSEEAKNLYFLKINDKPEYIISYPVDEYGDSTYAVIIRYQNGKVRVSENIAGGDYSTVKINLENLMIRCENQSSGQLEYYIIANGDFMLLDSYEPISSGEYGADQKKYNKYNFEEIKTELTDSNIDKYVK